MTRLLAALLGIGMCAGVHPAWALVPGEAVENFRLLDQNGEPHELYAAADHRAVVILIQGNGCPIARQVLPALAELRAQYRERGVEFLLLNANLQDDRAAVLAEAKEFQIAFPILLDDTQLVAESLGVERTAEVFVIDTKTWTLAYRGPLDDRLFYERQRAVAEHTYVRDALEAVLAGKTVPVPAVDAVGCLVNLPGVERRREHATISYALQVAPLLREHCGSCHTGPSDRAWTMSSYEQVREHARSIRQTLRTRGGTGTAAQAHIALFEGAQALSLVDRQTLVHWIEAGSPRGEGGDPLREARPGSE
jgi:peroxiredoxin